MLWFRLIRFTKSTYLNVERNCIRRRICPCSTLKPIANALLYSLAEGARIRTQEEFSPLSRVVA